jgi:hypothetical protein
MKGQPWNVSGMFLWVTSFRMVLRWRGV